ncbi:MAG TPA: metal ABC transporter permease, partial [Acidimicrobiales bacterium]|nr:metal ABC transporter permease [Acidimicrobiales bacterium]
TGAAITVLFGSVFAVSSSTVVFAASLGAVALALVALTYRPLLLSSVNLDLAAAQQISPRLLEAAYMAALALAVALSALTIGAILSTALLVGPAATALRLTRSPGRAVAAATALALGTSWAGMVIAYDSYNWPPAHHGWPVSFFVVTLILACYLLAQLGHRWQGRRGVQGHQGGR